MLRITIHLIAHFAVPAVVAKTFFKHRWQMAFVVMVATMAVDLDHLLATPIFDPDRCGIGYHPLHSYPAISAYAVAFLIKPLRLVALGLLIHMALDGIDCVWMGLAADRSLGF
jgi:hypothetical protein